MWGAEYEMRPQIECRVVGAVDDRYGTTGVIEDRPSRFVQHLIEHLVARDIDAGVARAPRLQDLTW